ncbi:hypothetical protein SAMN05421780_105169 [Flexibacter flexilis DSM 6793]|uniref:Uncharacterized protein n=1 Tax=Flexibacter flexilis DSM 6793 TaxID=927664 RepID=A0A1I1J1N3_9BACT|nr:hypothetical protein [Flexibacter flexilis]SFC42376.1 hypothetical protein SAMN05421780_105169 [Flexibacter flexilis DSM 6793]
MNKSISLAGIIGPSLLVMVGSETRFWNPSLYDTQITPLVYMSGTLLFIAGLAIVRQHSVWVWKWPVLITMTGWLGMLLGIARMFFPQTYQRQFHNDNSALAVELLLIAIGILLTYKAYFGKRSD